MSPVIHPGGVVNSADYGPVVSAGSIVAIYGTNLAPNTVVASEKPLPATLGGVSVVVRAGGQELRAPLFFVSAGQINAQLPYGLGGQRVEILVRNSDGASNIVQVSLQHVSPRFYTKSMDGRGEALLVHHPSYQLVSEAAPALPGEITTLFLTGLGEVTPTLAAGAPAGDGAGLGPLNSVNQHVEVWVGAERATVLWAGLTPNLAGLYQINLTMPAVLPDGLTDIRVTCGGDQTQANVKVATASSAAERLTPEAVVKRSLEAQVRGDIDGMLSYWALDRYDAANVAGGREALTRLRNGIALSNFQFRHLATGYGDLGNLALVRAEISFSLSGRGLSTNETEGIFAILVGGRGKWKIYSIDPDDLQNMVIYDRRKAGSSQQKAVRRADGLRTPEQVSEDLNRTMVNRAANEGKMAADGIMNRVGAVPGYGDVAAVVYQSGCVAYDSCQAIDEYKKNGFTPIFFLNLSQVAVGVLQIVTEPVPGVDTAADMVQLWLERLTSMHELRAGVKELAAAIRVPRFDYNPWLFLPPASVWKRPGGFEESVSPEVEVAYGRPLQAIGLTNASCIDKPIPFVVVGEVPVPSGLEKVAERLGAKKVGAEWKIPLDLTQMALADKDLNEGDGILRSYRKQPGPKETGLVVAWKSSCVRGYQKLKVGLSNGEDARGPEVINKFMNFIQKLDVPQLEQGKLKVGVDQVKSFQVIGSGLQGTGSIDLSSKFECLQMQVSEGGSLVTLNRTLDKLEVEGLGAGTATLKMILLGSAVRPTEFPNFEAEVPIEVAGAIGGTSWTKSRNFLFYNNYWSASMTATVETDGRLVNCAEREFGRATILTCGHPPADPSKTDTYTVTVNFQAAPATSAAAGPGTDWEQFVKGQFDRDPIQDGGKLGGTFVKTFRLQRGKGGQTTFSAMIYYRYKGSADGERWWAGDTVFSFQVE